MEIRCRRRKFTPKPAVMQEQTGEGMGSQGNVLGGTMIIAGTAIGAGMLALPMISAGMWIYWSLLLMVLTWMLMLRASQAILEVNLHYEPGSRLPHARSGYARSSLEHDQRACRGLVLYILVYAYVSGGGSTVQQTVMAVTGNDPGDDGLEPVFLVDPHGLCLVEYPVRGSAFGYPDGRHGVDLHPVHDRYAVADPFARTA